jgi:hypothetical protein
MGLFTCACSRPQASHRRTRQYRYGSASRNCSGMSWPSNGGWPSLGRGWLHGGLTGVRCRRQRTPALIREPWPPPAAAYSAPLRSAAVPQPRVLMMWPQRDHLLRPPGDGSPPIAYRRDLAPPLRVNGWPPHDGRRGSRPATDALTVTSDAPAASRVTSSTAGPRRPCRWTRRACQRGP